jgi:hypothetical protein
MTARELIDAGPETERNVALARHAKLTSLTVARLTAW